MCTGEKGDHRNNDKRPKPDKTCRFKRAKATLTHGMGIGCPHQRPGRHKAIAIQHIGTGIAARLKGHKQHNPDNHRTISGQSDTAGPFPKQDNRD